MDTIFISIAACKEKFLAQTIKSAILNAKNPELLYFGICNMVIDDEDFLSDPVFERPNVNYVETKHKSPLGTGFGRMNASLMFDREHRYLFQVDAHTIFNQNWDETLKKYYNQLLDVCDKPIISIAPQMWAEDDQGRPMLFDNKEYTVNPYILNHEATNPTLTLRENFNLNGLRHPSDFKNYLFIDGLHYDWKKDEDFVEHGLVFAACMFSDFSLVREVMHDPLNPWDGDQINFTLRVATRGYRMFSVKKCFMWTKNKFRNGSLISEYDWRRCEGSPVKGYNDKNSNILQTDIFTGSYTGYWGAPSKESILEYEKKMSVVLSDYFNINNLK